MATLTGKTLGKYQIYERIGRGGMADVYKGRHTRLDREVAIKVLHAYLAEGQDFLTRFEREARAIASLQHPHIVQVYDFDVEDELAYMVMEFIGGGNLRLQLEDAFTKKTYLPLEQVARLLQQIGEGLDYAHSQGMLHRDIKPANVLLRENGDAVLADFGIARILSDTQFTATGSLIGTPAYMSPEQGRGETLTPASDLYGLGIILYEMLTNHVPFDSETPLAIIHKQIHDPLPALTEYRDDLPRGLVQVVERALAKDPANRFASAAVLMDNFENALPGSTNLEQEAVPEHAATVVMEDSAEAPGETVVMQDESALEATIVMEEEAASPRSDVDATPEPALPPEPAGAPTQGEEGRRQGTAVRRWLPLGLVLATIGLVVVGAVSGWFSSPGPKCGELGQCVELANNALRNGHHADAVALYDQAFQQISPDEQPPFAELWCRRADALLALDRPDEAVQSFESCAAWTHDLPDLQPLREEAVHRIDAILAEGR
jgi:tRNA A-37 threonylcarbamoyl transferase component Bud32